MDIANDRVMIMMILTREIVWDRVMIMMMLTRILFTTEW